MWEFSCSLVWRGSCPRFGVVQRHSKAELTRVIVQCSGRGNLPHRGIPPQLGRGDRREGQGMLEGGRGKHRASTGWTVTESRQ